MPLVVYPHGVTRVGFRDGGKRLAPDGGPEVTDGDRWRAPGLGIAWTPERHLQLAVLEDARHLLAKYRGTKAPKGRELLAQTVAWFVRGEDGTPFAFEAVCASLRLDAEAVRAALRAQGLLPDGPRASCVVAAATSRSTACAS